MEQVVRNAIKEVGYDDMEKGFDWKKVSIINVIDKQSPEIDAAVTKDSPEKMGAGDQGLMIGYATNETESCMPMTMDICNKLVTALESARRNKKIAWLRPDGKVQVSIEYSKHGSKIKPERLHTVLVSAQHDPTPTMETIREEVKKHIIMPHLPPELVDEHTKFIINPSEKFILGGPAADAGLTGRKIIVDSYGGWGGHGGGAFSGKDPTKVDRSGAYMARRMAKSLVCSKLCDRCTVQLSYGIGIAEPISVFVDSHGTGVMSDSELLKLVLKHFDLRVGMIISSLKLRRPIFRKTSSGGHFRPDEEFEWEKPLDLLKEPVETEEQKQLRRKQEKEARAVEKGRKVEAAKARKEEDKPKEKDKKEHAKKAVNYEFPPLELPPPETPRHPTKEAVLITSALPYVNNVPHLGNIIGCVLSADVFARYCRQRDRPTLYICGTDEYGTATEVKALMEKATPREICDKYHALHRDIYRWFDIAFDVFGRTSEPEHQKLVQEMYLALKEHGLIAVRTLEQTHCPHCDMFLADRYVVGVCPHCEYKEAKGDQCDGCGKLLSPEELKTPRCMICKNTPQAKPTEHAFLELDKVQPETEKWLEQAMLNDWDENAKAITKAWLKQGLRGRCITRDLKWGVPVPDMPGKVFYVWFDAPIGYISITAKALPETYLEWWQNPHLPLYQFMGKDNVPFHSVVFPSTCLGSRMGWTMLHRMSTTEYLNYEGGKFSKSSNLGVFGDNVQALGIPPEVWRYYLLANRPEKADSDFNWADFQAKNNNELLANPGNLCNRVINLVHKLQAVPVRGELAALDLQLLKDLQSHLHEYCARMDKVQIKEGLRQAMEISALGNKYIQEAQPWEKAVKDSGRSLTVLALGACLLKFLALVFEPFMPGFTAKLNYLLAEPNPPLRSLQSLQEGPFEQTFLGLVEAGRVVREPIVLFREFADEELEGWAKSFRGE